MSTKQQKPIPRPPGGGWLTRLEVNLYRKEYAPGIACLLRELAGYDDDTIRAAFPGQQEDAYKKLSVLLCENLEFMVAKTFALETLSRLSFLAMRERAGYPSEATPTQPAERGA